MIAIPTYAVTLDAQQFLQAFNGDLVKIRANVGMAVAKVAEAGAMRWKSRVMHARLWERDKSSYVESIAWRMTGETSAEVASGFRYAAAIEEGRPARDLKAALETSAKVRRAKSGKNAGKRYLVIPFRHNTTGQSALARPMPSHVNAAAAALAASSVLGMATRLSGQVSGPHAGSQVPARVYAWGGRLPAGLAPKLKPHHATDPYAGMVRFKTNAPGSTRSSAYLTFRVMMEGSPKWLVPPKPGLYLARQVVDELNPLVPTIVSKLLNL